MGAFGMDQGQNGSVCIIGAGYGRTGTSSLKVALEKLGFGPTYHMKEVFKNGRSHVQFWQDTADDKPVDWRHGALQGYLSTTDFPASCFYHEQMEAFPDAKVILTYRDFEGWYTICQNTIAQVRPGHLIWGPARWVLARRTLRMIDSTTWQRLFHNRMEDKEYVRQVFEAHLEEVKSTVPADRLLVYHVKEGWGPLCAFLDVPVPEGEFPRINDTKEFQRGLRVVSALVWTINLTTFALPVALAGGLAYYFTHQAK